MVLVITLKIPLLYGFKIPISKKTCTILQLGINFQIQLSSSTTTFIWNNSTMLNIISKSGVYPLVHLNYGFGKEFKNKKINFLIGINKGFIIFLEINHITKPSNIISKSHFNGTYYEVKVNWSLFN